MADTPTHPIREPEDAGCEPIPAALVELHQLQELAALRQNQGEEDDA